LRTQTKETTTAGVIVTGSVTEVSAQTLTAKKAFSPSAITEPATGILPLCGVVGTYDFDTTVTSEEPVMNGFVLWAMPGASNPRNATNYSPTLPSTYGTPYLGTHHDFPTKMRSDHQQFELWLNVKKNNPNGSEASKTAIQVDLSQPETRVVIWMGGPGHNTATVKIRPTRIDC
jgi:hypothetical protein